MSKIRKLYYFDKKNTQEMISFLNNNANDAYINRIMFNPLVPLHHLLPINMKFLPESYVLKDNADIKGIITIAPMYSMQRKFEIQKLLFEENSIEDATELVQYIVSKYKAMGAISIMVKVDDYLHDLLEMFISRCGFSQISYEKIWRVNNIPQTEFDKKEFRSFKNSDAKAVANMYDASLLPHFRPLLGRETREFNDDLFKGLSYYTEYKYIIEDKNTKNITGYLSIKTSDNENFMLDIIQSSWINMDINSIINFAASQIRKRKSQFGLFITTKRYTNKGEELESIFAQNGFECAQNRIVLTNSSARVLKENEKSGRYTVLNNFIPTNGIVTQ